MHIRRQKTLLEKAQDLAQDVAVQVRPQVESALETAKHSAQEARTQAAPYIEQGKIVAADKAQEAAGKAQVAARAAQVMATAAAAKAAAAAADQAGTAKQYASDKAATLKGEPPKKKGGKLKKLLFVGVLVAIGGVIFSRVRGGQDANWQTSYVPSPPPKAQPTTPPAASTNDSAGGTPGEALSDAVEEPHAATTPDAPADVIDIEDAPGSESRS